MRTAGAQLAGWDLPAAAPAPAPPREPVPGTARLGVRLLAVCAVGAYGLGRWLALLADPPRGAVVATVALAAGLGAALLAGRRLRTPAARWALGAAAALGALAGGLLAAGVGARLLAPTHWGRLASGLATGVAGLPQVTVPYHGADGWARVVLAACGCALVLVAALAATRPRGPAGRGVALVALGVLLAVPAVQLPSAHPWAAGSAVALGLAAALHAERLSARRAPAAVGLLVAATAAAALLAPRLDLGRPLLDVQGIGTALQARGGEGFDWNHSYGPLDWPRDGREVLRVRARDAAYWKAESLEDFDGVRWRARATPEGLDTETDPEHREWVQRIGVRVGDMHTAQFVAAGTTWFVDQAPRKPIAGTAGSLVSDGLALGRGSTYRALVYVPRPSAAEMRAAGLDFPSFVAQDDLGMRVAQGAASVRFPAWGDPSPPVLVGRDGQVAGPATGALRASPYARVYALARTLRAGAATPYDFARAVERHLARGFVYDEDPLPSSAPLATFLLRDRRGYCQQFSGAMALLLRMGGVPARVAAGFSPGQFDRAGHEYVVRDTDAHSWVEAYFPSIGWATFDPTPPTAPARAQFAALPTFRDAGSDAPGAAIPPAVPRDRERAPQPPPPQAPRDGTGTTGAAHPGARDGAGGRAASDRSGGALPALGALAAALAAGALALALRTRRRRRPDCARSPLVELERALRRAGRAPRPGTTLRELEERLAASPPPPPPLRRAGRAPRPGTTLRELEERLAASPPAREYLRAVRAERYGHGAAPPTSDQRRALRAALAAGRGLRGRLRALYALPPRLPGA